MASNVPAGGGRRSSAAESLHFYFQVREFLADLTGAEGRAPDELAAPLERARAEARQALLRWSGDGAARSAAASEDADFDADIGWIKDCELPTFGTDAI
jgi:hypothetical protein